MVEYVYIRSNTTHYIHITWVDLEQGYCFCPQPDKVIAVWLCYSCPVTLFAFSFPSQPNPRGFYFIVYSRDSFIPMPTWTLYGLRASHSDYRRIGQVRLPHEAKTQKLFESQCSYFNLLRDTHLEGSRSFWIIRNKGLNKKAWKIKDGRHTRGSETTVSE